MTGETTMLVPVGLAALCGTVCGSWLLRHCRGLRLAPSRRYWTWTQTVGTRLGLGAMLAFLMQPFAVLALLALPLSIPDSARVAGWLVLLLCGAWPRVSLLLWLQGCLMALVARAALASCDRDERRRAAAAPRLRRG
jgi:sterol desaturase/sphingolipid hydroxylase (fatty acid hydroxylase superfamily)